MRCFPKEQDQVSPLFMTSGPSQDVMKTVCYPTLLVLLEVPGHVGLE